MTGASFEGAFFFANTCRTVFYILKRYQIYDFLDLQAYVVGAG